MSNLSRATWIVIVAVAALLAFVAWLVGGRGDVATEVAPPHFVGRATCAPCHPDEHAKWLGSHHDLAMQPISEATNVGAFDGQNFDYSGVQHRFERRGDRFFVRTDGGDGELADYEVSHAFGVEPLQQYLVPFADGRRQVLGLCWDTRPAGAGGQRWFHLYPDRDASHTSAFHWTAPLQNWNSMCAECHSTGFEKRYDKEADRFESRWFEIDVSCESCHGPGSNHVRWAEAGDVSDESRGLVATLADRDNGEWIVGDDGIPRRSVPRESHAEIETCARCHSRRSVLQEEYVPGRSLLQTHLPSLIEEPLYHVDGQIHDEVYVYGSFRQSKMYASGVTCRDCHDPHSGELLLPGNDLCGRCHPAQKYDSPAHHHHADDSAGVSCVACHMPSRNYMVVDPRRDHSLRVPRPDLSVKLGVPNACNGCHADQSAEWAQASVAEWYPAGRWQTKHYGEVIRESETLLPSALRGLADLAVDPAAPSIVRATALDRLGRLDRSQAHVDAIRAGLTAKDPLERVAAVRALEGTAPAAHATALLDDPVRAVRVEAARVLAPLRGQLAEHRQSLDAALNEYMAAQNYNAERGEAHLNLGNLFVSSGNIERAEVSFRRAIELQPFLAAAYVNLADLLRHKGQDAEGEAILRAGLSRLDDDAGLRHAYGLWLSRAQRPSEAIAALRRATELAADNGRYAYVYAVAVASSGDTEGAILLLESAFKRWPGDRDIAIGLFSYQMQLEQFDAALAVARRLAELYPDDASVQRSIEELRRRNDR